MRKVRKLLALENATAGEAGTARPSLGGGSGPRCGSGVGAAGSAAPPEIIAALLSASTPSSAMQLRINSFNIAMQERVVVALSATKQQQPRADT